MKKLAAALIASLFASVAFAQTAAPAAPAAPGAAQSATVQPAAPAATAPAAHKKHTHKVSAHHKAKPVKLESSKAGGKDTLK